MSSTEPRARRLRPDPLALAAIAALTAVLFSPFVLQGRVFLAADTLRQFLPWRTAVAAVSQPHNTLITDPLNHNWAGNYNRALKEGRIDRWQPLILAGLPATEVTGQTGSPGRHAPLKLLFHRLFGTTTAFMLVLMSQILLMGVTMHLYLREIGAGRRGALFGAVVYMFNGSAMVWLEFESVPGSSALLPALLLALERFRTPARWTAACVGALLLGTLALMGQLQYVIYTAVLLGCSLLFLLYRELRAGGGWRRALPLLGCFAVMAAGGALIAAVQLLPTLDIARESQRIDRTFGFREYFDTLGRVPWRYFVTLLFPDFFGSPPLGFNAIPRLPRQEYMNYNELCLYLGVPALFALLAAFCARGNRFSRFYLGLVGLVAAWLAGTWLYYPLFALVPGMNRMNPTRLTFLFVFVAAVAAGLGFARLPHLRGRRRTAFLAAAGLLLAVVALLAVAGARPWVHGVFDREAAQGPWAPQLLAGLRQLRSLDSPVMYRQLLLALAAAALLAGALLLRGRRRSACAWLLVLLAAGDLIRFGRAYNSYADPPEVYPRTPALDFLLAQPRPFRVVQDAGRGFYVNTLAPFGIEEIGGYSSFYPDRTGALLAAAAFGPAALEGRRFDRWVTFRGGSRLFDLLNVRYLLTAPGASRASPGLRLVYRGEVEIYESATALPRAWVARRWVPARSLAESLVYLNSESFDPREEIVAEAPPDPAFAASVSPPPRPDRVGIERHAPDEVVVTADVASSGWLVLADAWHPGWQARVDGGERPILRVDANLRAVALPAGAHRVVFTFDPPAYRWGRRLTVLGLLLALAGALGSWYVRRRAAPRAPAPVENV